MATIATVALVGLEAISQIQQGIAAREQAKYNAQVAEQRAEQARRAAEIRKYQIERRRKQLIGRQKALYAKAGVKYTEGSPLEVLADTEGQFDLEQAINKYNTDTLVTRNMSEASFQKYAGKQRMTAGFMNAGGTILGGASYNTARTPRRYSYNWWRQSGRASYNPSYNYEDF